MISRSYVLALFTLSIFTCEAKVATRYGDNFRVEQEVRNAFWKYWVPVDRITSKTYPDLYAKIAEQSKKIGIKAPYAFVYKGDFFSLRNNACAIMSLITKPFGGLIFIGSDFLEKMTEQELDFIISHELGHLKARQIAAMHLAVIPAIIASVNISNNVKNAFKADFNKYFKADFDKYYYKCLNYDFSILEVVKLKNEIKQNF